MWTPKCSEWLGCWCVITSDAGLQQILPDVDVSCTVCSACQ